MTQERDRALLFYAAKAAGIEFNNASLIPMRVDNGMNTLWDPLTDDGDALRLAVKLKLKIVHWPSAVEAHLPNDARTCYVERFNDDQYAAARRAIIRAAAEIGKAME